MTTQKSKIYSLFVKKILPVLVLALQIACTVVEKGVAADAEVFASVFASLVAVAVVVADAAAVAGFVAAEMVCSSLLYQTLVSSHTEGENLSCFQK